MEYKFKLGYSLIRHDVRDELSLSNHEYAIAHALMFVSKKNTIGKRSQTNYQPTVKTLAKDLGLGSKTIYRALLKLREKNLIEPDCLEATEHFVIAEQAKKANRFLCDDIQHGHRENLGLNFTQYLVCSIYSRLGKDREWVTLDKKEIAKTVDICVEQLNRIIKQMVMKELMETQLRRMSNGKDFLDVKMTEIWEKTKKKEDILLSAVDCKQ